MAFRDIKSSARRALHSIMKVPALYIVDGDDPIPVNVRVHSDWTALGEVSGTSFDYAEKQEITPRIIFMRDEVPSPARGAIVSISVDEAWLVDHTEPADGISIAARASRIPAAQRVGLPVP